MPVKKSTKKAATKKSAKRKTAVKKTATKTTAKRKVAKKVAKPKKAVSKKATAKKTTAKRTSTKKAVVKKPATVRAIKDKLTGVQLYNMIAERTELSKKQVLSVFEELSNIMEGCLKKNGVGEFSLPKLAKITVKKKPATRARKGINPFTGENIMIKAKPARRVVKVRPLKKLKEMAE